MRYYIADLHFYHSDLNTRMDNRGFESMEAMNSYMIDKWNRKVRKNDEVVILGDFSLAKGGQTNELVKQLNGRLHLIRGNHDRFLHDKEFDTGLFKWIEPYKEVSDNRRKVILSHYPVFCYNGQYRRNSKGNPTSFMLYGHVHNTYDEVLLNRFINETKESRRTTYKEEGEISIPCQMINCFCMFSDYEPLTLDEWIECDMKRRMKMSS